MRTTLIAFTLVVAAIIPRAFAQMPAMSMKNMASSVDIQALIAKAKADRKEGQASVNEVIVELAPYRVGLAYRVMATPPAVHEKDDELFYIIEGSGILTVGGALVDIKRINLTNLRGVAIQGGVDVQLSKGDFYIVPENTPHMITPVGGPLVDMSLHLSGSVPTR